MTSSFFVGSTAYIATQPTKNGIAAVALPAMVERIEKSETEWVEELTPAQYDVLRRKGTEPAFTGKYVYNHDDGMYRCAACGAELFSSDTKFESGSGWPSFFEPAVSEHIATHEDNSHGMHRVEVTCARCGGHLGHVFPDGPNPTGTRYCINSLSLDFEPATGTDAPGDGGQE